MPTSSYAKRSRPARSAANTGPKPWVVQIGPEFYDHAKTPISDRLFSFLVRLESYARDKPFLWTSNEQLEAITGHAGRTIRELFEEGEAAGWFVRVFSDRGQRNRIGIIMKRRVGPVGLAADTPERVDQCRRYLLAGTHLVKDSEPFAFDADRREASPQPRRISADIDGGFPPSTYGGNPPQKNYHSEKNEVNTAAAPPVEQEPPLLSSTSGEGEGKPRPTIDPALLAQVIERTAQVYAWSIEVTRPRVEWLAQRSKLTWIASAVERVADVNKREDVGWGLLVKILRDYDGTGGPPPPRKAKAVSRPDYLEEPPVYDPPPHRAPVRNQPKPITFTAEELAIYGPTQEGPSGIKPAPLHRDPVRNIPKPTEEARVPLTDEEVQAKKASILAALKARREQPQVEVFTDSGNNPKRPNLDPVP